MPLQGKHCRPIWAKMTPVWSVRSRTIAEARPRIMQASGEAASSASRRTHSSRVMLRPSYAFSKMRRISRFTQTPLFFSDVCFGPKNLGLEKKEVELRAYAALKQVGIADEYFYQSPFDLSGGQKRRVAIAGVLAMEPEVLILDEPTAGLDPKGRDEIFDCICKLREKLGITVILVSHSMEDVAKHVDRIIVMNQGKVLMDDVPREIFKRYKELETVGLAAPQVTYIMEEMRKKGLPVDTSVLTVEEARDEILRVLLK